MISSWSGPWERVRGLLDIFSSQVVFYVWGCLEFAHLLGVLGVRDIRASLLILGIIGTFARVWLVRLADPAEEDRDKVFALKVLWKVEGK